MSKRRQHQSPVISQHTPMLYDPAFGTPNPEPDTAEDYRAHHGPMAWLFNPWRGKRRHPRDVGGDVFGVLILPEEEQKNVAN